MQKKITSNKFFVSHETKKDIHPNINLKIIYLISNAPNDHYQMQIAPLIHAVPRDERH